MDGTAKARHGVGCVLYTPGNVELLTIVRVRNVCSVLKKGDCVNVAFRLIFRVGHR